MYFYNLTERREKLLELTGVDVMENESEYKDIYEIFTELASVWDSINGDEAKARVAELSKIKKGDVDK